MMHKDCWQFMHNMLKIRQLHLSILFRLKKNSDAELRIRLRSIHIWWQYHRERLSDMPMPENSRQEKPMYVYSVETSVYVKQGLTRSICQQEQQAYS